MKLLFAVYAACAPLLVFGRVEDDPVARINCCWHPNNNYRDRSILCCGRNVTLPPRLLPPTLVKFVMSDTALRVLNASVFQDHSLPQLTTLAIRDGILERVDKDALSSLPELVKLDLSNNTLKYVDADSFISNKVLHSLDLSNNTNLEQPPNITSPSLEKLNLESCNLKHAEVSAFTGLPNITTIYLDGNPSLNCTMVKRKFSEAKPNVFIFCQNEVEENSFSRPRTQEATTQKARVTTSHNMPQIDEATTQMAEVRTSSTCSLVVITIAVVLIIFSGCIFLATLVRKKRIRVSKRDPYNFV